MRTCMNQYQNESLTIGFALETASRKETDWKNVDDDQLPEPDS